VVKNAIFFITTYKNYSQGSINETELKNILFEFILTYSEQFNGMFSTIFNFNIENFIKELKINLIRKIKRMKELEKTKSKLPDNDILENIETALKSAFYMHFRYIYNHIDKFDINDHTKSAIFFFIRNFAYGGMFRYNSLGQFNAPYGGMQYNKKNIQKKVNYLKSKQLLHILNTTVIENLDFEDFLNKYKPLKDDFVFFDPPYDTEFSTYTQNKFGKEDQERLSNYLINDCKSHWMLVIKNTKYIKSLYSKKGLFIKSFDKTYLVSFMNRNEKNTEHLLITNYKGSVYDN
jgi:DNA adenine methylase